MKGRCTHETSRNLGSIGKAVHTLSWFPPNKSRFFATVPLCAEYLAGCAAVKFMDRTWSPGWHSILQLIPPIFCRSWSSKSRKFKDVIFAKPMSWHTCQQQASTILAISCWSLRLLCKVQSLVTNGLTTHLIRYKAGPQLLFTQNPANLLKTKDSARGLCDFVTWIRRPGSACTVFFSYVASKILSQGAHPKSPVQNPKSKIPKIQNPQNPKSPNSKIPKIQNPSFFGRILGILDLGLRPQNPKSKLPKIQNPQNPKSSAKIQNLGRWGPHIKNCYITIQNPKSKIPKIRPKKLGFWILGILDFGIWGFWILGILDFGFWDFGDFGFWTGDFGFWDFGDFGFWILGFWGGPGDVPLGNLVAVPGGQRLESPLVCLWGPLQNQLYRIELGQGSKLNIFSEVRTLQNHRKTLTSNPEVRTLQNHRKTQTSNPEVRTLQNHRKNPDFQPRGQNFTKSQKNLDFSPYRRILSILSVLILASFTHPWPRHQSQNPNPWQLTAAPFVTFVLEIP